MNKNKIQFTKKDIKDEINYILHATWWQRNWWIVVLIGIELVVALILYIKTGNVLGLK